MAERVCGTIGVGREWRKKVAVRSALDGEWRKKVAVRSALDGEWRGAIPRLYTDFVGVTEIAIKSPGSSSTKRINTNVR